MKRISRSSIPAWPRAARRRCCCSALKLGGNVDLRALVLGQQRFERAFEDLFAEGKNRHAVRHFLHLLEQVRRKDHGLAHLFQPQDEVANLGRAERIDARGRFVEEKKIGIVDQRLRQADALEHALRIGAQGPLAAVLQADEIDQFLDPLFELGDRSRRKACRKNASVSSPFRKP